MLVLACLLIPATLHAQDAGKLARALARVTAEGG